MTSRANIAFVATGAGVAIIRAPRHAGRSRHRGRPPITAVSGFELLIGAAMRGFRVVEVPATVHQCAAGRSRKGNDLINGARFGWVVLSTRWREQSGRPR
jgi:hypothetical protein